MKIKLFGELKPGSFSFYHDDLALFNRWQVKGKPGPKTIAISDTQTQRSLQQLKYWWPVIVRMIADAMGELDDQYVHKLLMVKFFPREIMSPDGEIVTVGRSMSDVGDVGKKEFSEKKEKIQIWAHQFLRIEIPDPKRLGK